MTEERDRRIYSHYYSLYFWSIANDNALTQLGRQFGQNNNFLMLFDLQFDWFVGIALLYRFHGALQLGRMCGNYKWWLLYMSN